MKQKLILHIQNLTRRKIVLVLCCSIAPSILLILLIKFDFLKWNAEFKLADFVGIIAASLTLWAIYISSKAAKSAQVSAEIARDAAFHTEQQTILLKEQFMLSISPKLIPSLIKIDKDHFSITDFGDSKFLGDLVVTIKNVGKGNAYYIQSWIELENKDVFLESGFISNYVSPLPTFKYTLEFIKSNGRDYPRILVREVQENSNGNSRHSNKSFDIVNPTVPHPYLNENDSNDFSVHSYVQALLIDSIFNGPYRQDPNVKDKDLNYNFILYIKYQTESQLESGDYSLSAFEVVLFNGKLSLGAKERIALTVGFKPKYTKVLKK